MSDLTYQGGMDMNEDWKTSWTELLDLIAKCGDGTPPRIVDLAEPAAAPKPEAPEPERVVVWRSGDDLDKLNPYAGKEGIEVRAEREGIVSNHILNVTNIERDEDGALVDYEYTIECPTGTCGWGECPTRSHHCEDHPNGESDDYCEVCDPDFGNEHHFHGQDHRYMVTFGWAIEYNGCCVSEFGCDDVGCIIDVLPGVGRYYVDDDWDDCFCLLSLIGPVER